jgi:hypothetical protein
VIPLAVLNFAAKNVVAPEGVAEDHRKNKQRAHQHKALALRRRGGLPQGDAGGIICGQILIPSPLKPRKISPSVRINGSRWLALLRSARHSQALIAATSSGTGSRKKRFGKLNQRSAMAVCASGSRC